MSQRVDGYVVQTLRLHTDQHGLVWYGDECSVGQNSHLNVADFFAKVPSLGYEFRRIRKIRLLGTRANAPLVMYLQQTQTAEPGNRQRVELGSPSICPIRSMLSQPETVLRHMLQPETTSALSGSWHVMGKFDYCSYAMAASIDKAKGKITDEARYVLQYHPAWPALAFIPYLETDHACHVLADMLDPRWFIHDRRPGRWTRLFRFFGLTPVNISAFLRGSQPERNFTRAHHLISMWYNEKSIVAFNDRKLQRHDAFLWKIFSRQDVPERGIIRGSERLLKLVASLWLGALSPQRQEVAFDPTRFFKHQAEAAAFQKHLLVCLKRV